MESRCRSYSTNASTTRFQLDDLDLVDVIENEILVTATFASKNVDIVLDNAACMTIPRCWNLAKLLAFDPTEELWLLTIWDVDVFFWFRVL